MSFNLILLKFVLFVGLTRSWAVVINKDKGDAHNDMQTSATSAKLINLASLFGYGNSGSYPNYNRPGYYPNSNQPGYYPNYNRPGYYPNYGYNTNEGYYPNGGTYPTTNVAGYYPNTNYYPTTGTGTNILGGGYGGNGGYGGYGGNGGLRQYYGYWDPNYIGQRNIGYGYYANSNNYGLPRSTNDHLNGRERDRVPYTFRGYN